MSEEGARRPLLADPSRLLTDEEVLRRAHQFVRKTGGSSSDEDDEKRRRRREKRQRGAAGDGDRRAKQKANDPTSASWVAPAVREYESKLFKEYTIVDLSRATAAVLSAAAAAKARAEKKEKGDGNNDDADGGGVGGSGGAEAAQAAPPIGLRWRVEREVLSGKGESTCAEKSCPERRGLETLELPFAYREAGRAKAALVKCRLCSEHARVARWAAKRAKGGEGKNGGDTEGTTSSSCSSSGGGSSGGSGSGRSDEEKERRKKRRKKKGKKKKKKKKKKTH